MYEGLSKLKHSIFKSLKSRVTIFILPSHLHSSQQLTNEFRNQLDYKLLVVTVVK